MRLVREPETSRGDEGSEAGGEPEPRPGGRLRGWASILVGGAYLLNPSLGVFELLPDNLPLVGNLDEAAAAGLVLWGLRCLGIDLLGARRGTAGAGRHKRG